LVNKFNKTMKSLVNIGTIIILFFQFILFPPFQPSFINTSTAYSTWTQESAQDFNQGTSENVTVTSKDEVILDHHIAYIEDNFYDESKINYKENLIVNTTVGEIKLLRLFNMFSLGFGGSDDDIGNSVKQTSDGGFIITGYTKSYDSAGKANMWLIKTDIYGNIEWNYTYGGTGWDQGRSIQETSDGGFIIAGNTGSYGGSGWKLWLVKTNNTGYEEWNKTYGGLYGYFVSETSDNGFIFIGHKASGFSNQRDFYLVKTDKNGTLEWSKSYGGSTEDDEGQAVVQTDDGGYVLTGWTKSYGAGNEDLWVIKTNSTGNMVWNKTFGGSGDDRGHSIIETANNEYVITGWTRSFGHGNYDMWLLKLNSTGEIIWNKTHGGYSADSGYCVEQTTDDGYIAIGGSTSFGYYDAFLVKTNSTGDMQWNQSIDWIGRYDVGLSVNQTKDGGYVITGLGERWDTSVNSNVFDYLLIKTDPYGNTVANGELRSTNLLTGKNTSLIETFSYTSSLPSGTSIEVQFSQDNITWYNSNGKLNGWDELKDGINSINLSKRNWKGDDFYYRMIFSSVSSNLPVLQRINITYQYYFTSGSFISIPFNCNESLHWQTISWNATKPAGTDIKFQLRSSNTNSNLNQKQFIGPEGTASSFYSISPGIIWSGHGNDSWIQYKAYLSTSNIEDTPIIINISISYNIYPNTTLTNPANNTVTLNNKPTFSWNFQDKDTKKQSAFQVIIDDSFVFDTIDYDSGVQLSSKQQWKFGTGISAKELPDGIWYWKARTRDNNGGWSVFSKPYSILIDTIAPVSETIIPRNNAYYNNMDEISGIAMDNQTSSGLAIITISIQRMTDKNYWNGFNWIIGTSWLSATGTNDWYFDSRTVPWTSGVNYKIRSRSVDNASNAEIPGEGTRFIFDLFKPESKIDNPKDNSFLNDIDKVSGTAMEINGSGIDRVEICIKCIEEDNYWSGAGWTPGEAWLVVEGTYNWTYDSKNIYWISGNHYNIRSKLIDNIGLIESSKVGITFTFDNEPPSDLGLLINDGDEYTNFKIVTLSLSAIDTGTELTDMSFSTDGSLWTEWESYDTSSTFELINEDGVKTVHFRVRDRVGNIALPIYDSIVYDTTPPTKSDIVINNNDKYTNSTLVTLNLNAKDTLSGLNLMTFKFDDGAWNDWKPFSNTISISLPSGDGEKKVHLKVQDKASNNGNIVFDTIILDSTPPSRVTILINEDSEITDSGQVELSLDAIDKGSGLSDMALSHDGIIWTAWEPYKNSKFIFLPNGDGEKHIYLKVKDQVGNIAPVVFDSIIFDSTPPEISIEINSGEIYTSSKKVILNLTSEDNLSGTNKMAFNIDGFTWTNWEEYSNNKTISLQGEDGEKTIYFMTKDYAGNVADSVFDQIILDTQPPHSLSILINDGIAETKTMKVLFTLDALDDHSGVDEMSFSSNKITWSPWVQFNDTMNYNLSMGDGEKTIYFRVKDRMGNIAAPVIASIILNTTKSEQNDTSTKDTDKKVGREIILLITIIIVIIICIMLLIRRRRIKDQEKGKTVKQSIDTQPISVKSKSPPGSLKRSIQSEGDVCFTCGQQLFYMKEQGKSYCYHCKKYE
jgi:hypothetical protein